MSGALAFAASSAAFRGGVITIDNLTATQTVLDPATATASYELGSSGVLVTTNGSSDWITPKIGMDLYESRVTIVSGSLTSGTVNTWQALSSSRGWGLVQIGIGFATTVLTVQIRLASSGVVQDTATVTLTANVEL